MTLALAKTAMWVAGAQSQAEGNKEGRLCNLVVDEAGGQQGTIEINVVVLRAEQRGWPARGEGLALAAFRRRSLARLQLQRSFDDDRCVSARAREQLARAPQMPMPIRLRCFAPRPCDSGVSQSRDESNQRRASYLDGTIPYVHA